MRIKDEIKYIHIKKQQLNQHIYHLHLILANTWNNTWPYTQHAVEENLRKTIRMKYKNLDIKLTKLEQQQQKYKVVSDHYIFLCYILAYIQHNRDVSLGKTMHQQFIKGVPQQERSYVVHLPHILGVLHPT
jgi:hypothetical protein